MADTGLLGPEDTVFEFVPDAKNDAAGKVLLRLVVNPQSQSELSLGRSPENPIVVDNPTISGHHADLVFRYVTLPPSKQIPGMGAAVGMPRVPVCYIRDFSRNGIFVQGVPVGRGFERALADGDAVYLARNNQCRLLYRLRITYASALRCVVTQDAAFSLPGGGFSEAGFEAALSQAEISATAAARADAYASSAAVGGSGAAGAGAGASAAGGSSGGGLPARPAPIVREADVHADYDFDESSNESPDFLGDGGFSMVFKARNRATGELVAIKRVDVSVTEESAAQTHATVDPLEVEVAILRRLNHPHIVRLFEVIRPPPPPAAPAASAAGRAGGYGGGKPGAAAVAAAAAAPRKYMYIVTELVTGGELFYRVADGATPEPRARGLFRQLCKAVAYLHSQGLVHRDLKPENILLQPYLVTTTSRQPSGTASSREANAADAAGPDAAAASAVAAAAATGGSRTVSEKKYKVLVTDFGMAAMTDAFRGDTGIPPRSAASGPGAAAATDGARVAAAEGAGSAAASTAAGTASASSRAGSAGSSSSSSSSSLHSTGSSGGSEGARAAGVAGASDGAGPRHGAAAHRMMTSVGTKMYLAPEAFLRYEGGNPHSAAEQVERVLARAARAQGMLDWRRRPVEQLLALGDEDSEGTDARSGGSGLERRYRRPTGPGTSVGVPEPHSYRPGPDDYAAIADAHTRGYTSAVDSWALGIVLYMVLASSMPFWADGDEYTPSTRPPLLVQMMTGMMTLSGPPWDGVSEACKDLIRRMLHPNPHLRMSPEQALLHPWLARPAPAKGAAAGRGGRRTVAGAAGAAADAGGTVGAGEGHGEHSASVSPSSSALVAASGGPTPSSSGDPSGGGSAPEGAGAMASGSDAAANGAAEGVGHKRKHAALPAERASDGAAEPADAVSALEAGSGAPDGKRVRK